MDSVITSLAGIIAMVTFRNDLVTHSMEEKDRELIEKIHLDAIKFFRYMVSCFLGIILTVVIIKSFL